MVTISIHSIRDDFLTFDSCLLVVRFPNRNVLIVSRHEHSVSGVQAEAKPVV